ncbi:DUF3422 domain-containing protein [Sesbania bispinosa]|nr:DUF3422 domain-containing protein [Sesbania bispinosa]
MTVSLKAHPVRKKLQSLGHARPPCLVSFGHHRTVIKQAYHHALSPLAIVAVVARSSLPLVYGGRVADAQIVGLLRWSICGEERRDKGGTCAFCGGRSVRMRQRR